MIDYKENTKIPSQEAAVEALKRLRNAQEDLKAMRAKVSLARSEETRAINEYNQACHAWEMITRMEPVRREAVSE